MRRNLDLHRFPRAVPEPREEEEPAQRELDHQAPPDADEAVAEVDAEVPRERQADREAADDGDAEAMP